jgi:subtilase family serine protease
MRTFMLFIVLAALVSPSLASAGCHGFDLGISSVKVANVTSNGSLNHYTLVGTVTNTGDTKEPSNARQFVDIFTNGQRVNDRGIPPLSPGQSYTFSYVWQRSTDAGNATTLMRFSLRFEPPSQGNADCNPTNDTTTIRF